MRPAEESPKCPYCSNPLEAGLVQAWVHAIPGIRWRPVPESKLLGERLTPWTWLNPVGLAGYRCEHCRTLILRY